jgi:hypothetical protein
MGLGHWFRKAFHKVSHIVTTPFRMTKKLVKGVLHAGSSVVKTIHKDVKGLVKGAAKAGGAILKKGSSLIGGVFNIGKIVIIGGLALGAILILNARNVGQAAKDVGTGVRAARGV